MSIHVTRIEKEFLFKYLMDNEIEIEFHYHKYKFYCHIHKYYKESLSLSMISDIDFTILPFTIIKGFFYYQNNHHTFNVKFIEIKNDKMIIENPHIVIKNLNRKYERIPVKEDIKINFFLKGKSVELQYPKSNRFYAANKVPWHQDFSDLNLQNLYKKFKTKFNEKGIQSRIQMLKNYQPKNITENLVIKTGKIFWIENTHTDFPEKNPFPEDILLLKNDFIQTEKATGTPSFAVTSILKDFLYDKSKNDILSECIVPVIYQEYIVALIFLFTNHKYKKSITSDIIEYTDSFSKILAHALKQAAYFKNEETNLIPYNCTILDISRGGFLFCHDDPELEITLVIKSNLDIKMSINNKELPIRTKIMRKFENKNIYYFGAMYIDISRENLEHITNYIYKVKEDY